MKTEKDLDNLFKKGLDDPGSYKTYREEDWNALEAMLDKDKKRGIVYWLPLLSGVAATLLLAFGWYFFADGVKKPAGVQLAHIVKPQPTDVNAPTLTINKPPVSINADHVNPGKNDRPIQQQEDLQKTLRLPAHVTAKNGSTKNKSFLTLSAVDAGRATGPDQNNQTATRSTEMLAAVDAKVFTNDELDKAVVFGRLKANPTNAITKPDAQKTKISGFHPQYTVTVLAASALNGVGSFEDGKMGATGGLLFSVGLTKRFTISTGAVYAKTPYNTEFYNYHTSYKFKVDPETVNADCRVLDIPLNIDYKFAEKGRNSLSVGSGLSTYFMLKENYHYNYANPNPYWLSDVSIANRNSHFLGVLNLDATYQRQLNSKLSVALQPYLKLPLTDIGNGQVKLVTTGISVGMSWNINTLKR